MTTYTHTLLLKNILTIECGSDVTNFVASTLNKEVIIYYSVFQVDEYLI